MPRKAKGKGKKNSTTARPAKRRPKRSVTQTPEDISAPQPPQPPPAARAIPTLRPEPPSPLPPRRITRSSTALPPTPPLLPPARRTVSTRSLSKLSHAGPSNSALHATVGGLAGDDTESDDMPLVLTPIKRHRRQPERFPNNSGEAMVQTPAKKSMFEGISRDSLQRYMVHYEISKRQDLKKNLVKRVQKHFDNLDVNNIDMEALNRGVRERLKQTKLSSPGKMGNAGTQLDRA